LPMLIAAPQARGPGWRDEDIPAIRAMLSHLSAHVSYDEDRVLLAGFSAGGAMSLHLLYKESIPVTAVVALANYVPPRITRDEVHGHRRVPVFYAVGMTDVNHERMRVGIQHLRSAGGNVTLYRPQIGHQLDPQVGQAALDWFFNQCARRLVAAIEQAPADPCVARAAANLERIITRARWHEPAHVERASQMLEQIEAAGRADLADAHTLIARARLADAVEALREIESVYGSSRLGREARSVRETIEIDPAVRKQLADRADRRRAHHALDMYAHAQRLVARGKFAEAADHCRRVIQLYGDTPAAGRARFLLNLIEKRISP